MGIMFQLSFGRTLEKTALYGSDVDTPKGIAELRRYDRAIGQRAKYDQLIASRVGAVPKMEDFKRRQRILGLPIGHKRLDHAALSAARTRHAALMQKERGKVPYTGIKPSVIVDDNQRFKNVDIAFD